MRSEQAGAGRWGEQGSELYYQLNVCCERLLGGKSRSVVRDIRKLAALRWRCAMTGIAYDYP
jgi:hypothetical protein